MYCENKPVIVLLPGFDGSGHLFSPLCKNLSTEFETIVLSYPPDKVMTYSELEHLLKDELPDTPYVLLGESFGGPLAMLLSKRADDNLKGIILCVTFVVNPRPWPTLLFEPFIRPNHFRMGAPTWCIKRFLLGGVSDELLIKNIQFANRMLSPEVIYSRLKEIVNIDVTDVLEECELPILYLRAKRDWLVHESSMRIIKNIANKLTIKSFDAPHMLLQMKPVETAKCISNFAKGVLKNNIH